MRSHRARAVRLLRSALRSDDVSRNRRRGVISAMDEISIGPRDEVIVPSFTYIASVNTIAQTGATPVFVDSRLGDWLLDPADVARKITRRTKAIMPVHLYGAVCDMTVLSALAERHHLAII